MASETLTCSYYNSKRFDNTSTDESIHISTSNESSEEDFEVKSTDRKYLPKRLSTLSSSKRKPTRKPDPNTFNRNALMARENRRRKKEYVEKLEKEINIYRGTNKSLRKIFKKQSKIIEQLQEEKRYYRSIINNKSQILSVIKSLNTKECLFGMPLTNETPETSPSYTGFADNINLTNNNNNCDMDYNLTFGNHDSWEDILGCNSPFSEQTQQMPTMQLNNLQEIQSNIIDEHNYFNTKTFYDDNDDLYSDAGVCLHFTTGGKVSLEYCPTCHQKSSKKTFFNNQMDE